MFCASCVGRAKTKHNGRLESRRGLSSSVIPVQYRFLSRVEDPELLFPVLVKEMQEQLSAATEAEAKATATLKHCQRDSRKHSERIEKYKNGALQALKKEDETTARQAIESQIEAEKTADFTQRGLDTAQASCERATVARKRIQEQLEELQAKKSEILTRARVAKVQKKIQRTVSGTVGSTDSILDAVAKLEAQVKRPRPSLKSRPSSRVRDR